MLFNNFFNQELNILKRGVEDWNQWREKKPGFIPNLSNADLSDADLGGANLSNADLSDADLGGTNLSNADLSDANLGGANLSNADLSGANLSGANLRRTTLYCTNFSSANLRHTNLHHANLSGFNLHDTNLRRFKFHDTNLHDWTFRGVNWTDADLSYADLRSTNLRYAELIHTKLDRANLARSDLRYAKLNGAFLNEANLIYAYLDGADFSDSDLTNANLTRTQAIGTKFKGAIFTGACIEDWNVNSSTNLAQIICDYVYQKKDRHERRPSSGNFQPGDFTCLYQKAIETLNLIFQDGIDWKSFAATLQELNIYQKLNIEDEKSQLTVRAIEKRDDGSFVIRVDAPISIDKAEIELEFKKKYKKQLQVQAEQYRQQLQVKDIDIEHYRQQNTNLAEAIATLSNKPIKIENNFMATNESQGNTYNTGIGHVSGGDFKENKIAGTINEAANPSLADAAAEIRGLLTELEKSYPANTTTEKMVIATKAIERIEADSAWQQRTVNALKLGSIDALEKAIDNPIGAFLKGAFEGWNNER